MSMLLCSHTDVARSKRAANALTGMMAVLRKSCCDASRTIGRHHIPAVALMMAMIAGLTCLNADAAEAGQRFQVSGYGTLAADQPTQKSGNIQLKAYLTPKDAAIAALPPLQEGHGFALIAGLTAQSLVCYADTIFRDDFDADGG